eukprot:Skav211806  [mRNA]  locus=scaffold305:442774:461497:- [translate_table: standard]
MDLQSNTATWICAAAGTEVTTEALSQHDLHTAAPAVQKELELQLGLLLRHHCDSTLSIAVRQARASRKEDQPQGDACHRELGAVNTSPSGKRFPLAKAVLLQVPLQPSPFHRQRARAGPGNAIGEACAAVTHLTVVAWPRISICNSILATGLG